MITPQNRHINTNSFKCFLSLMILIGFVEQINSQPLKSNSPSNSNTLTSTTDFKITASTNSFIEIEFTPVYLQDGINFLNSFSTESNNGSPDVLARSFSVFLPTADNNRLEIIDYKYEDIANIDIKPVPTPRRLGDRAPISYEFVKDAKAYGTNAFFPSENASLISSGAIRNKYYANALISPVQYNPVTRVARKYSYIKFRVTFGGNPVSTNKPLSKEEYMFFKGMTLNSDIAQNWSTREFNSIADAGPTNSVLQSGDFYKIEVKETGMYKIDKNFLSNAGINVSGIDPRTIKIYGNGGQELPYNNAVTAPTDLVENKILVNGQDDGSFNDGDFIVFYGRSPNDWVYEGGTQATTHNMNPYSFSNYYWITFGGNNGLRMQNITSPSQPGTPQLPYFYAKFFEDPEVNNLGSTGTIWVSQRIGQGESFVFNKDMPGYVNGSDVSLSIKFGNGSTSSATFELRETNSGYSVLKNIFPLSNEFSHINLTDIKTTFSTGSNENIKLSLSLPTQYNDPAVAGYLDFYEILYKRRFSSVQNNEMRIQSIDTTGNFEYRISPFTAPNVRIFDITDKSAVDMIVPSSYTGGVATFQVNQQTGTPKEFYTIGGDNNYKTPVSISSKVPNQNLHGITDGASFVIISPTEFLQASNRLKSIRETPGPNYIKTMVVDVNKIYNEFGGGLLDPIAIRNFLKHAYNNWNERPVYVMFMGDGDYDFRAIYNTGTKNYMPPTQKSTTDVNEINSYPSDDFTTDITGTFSGPTATNPDFAVGRLCVNSLNEANTFIDKLEEYQSPSTNNIWKKKIMYVGDDGWTTSNNTGGEGSIHTDQCERIAEIYTPKEFEKEKIYIVNYPTVITPQGRRKPQANEDIVAGWNEGRLVVNYVGHGSADLWAHEQIFERQVSIPQLSNKGKYPLVTIASCDLARYDDPFFISAAEELVNLKDKGAIGVIAAVRPVYSTANAQFNERLWSNFMFNKDTLHLPVRIGKAMFDTKASLSPTDNNTKFSLISDPTIRLAIPQYFSRIDSINGTPGTDTAQIKALQKVKIYGSVLNADSSFWNGYNGDISLKIFDTDKNISVDDFGYDFNFRLDGGLIFAGKTQVTNGVWSLEFIVPRDISYNDGNAKLVGYFKNNVSDGSGYTNLIRLNGIDSSAAIDTTGPQISLYLGDRNFRSGDVINQNTMIMADLFDESGINLTGTIGHKIEAVLDGDLNNKVDLTTHYNATSGFQNGSLEYALNNISEGNHTLELRAWDTYNNLSTSSVDFSVSSDQQLTVDNVYNYPNPMQDNTSFLFNQNLDSPLDVKIRIYTVSGRLIKELNNNNVTDKFVKIDWNGMDDDGDFIANGTYIYRLVVKTQDGSFNSTYTGKLAKLK